MQQDTIVKERTALAVQPEQGEDTIDLLELFMGLLAHWTLIAATAVVGAVLMALYTFFLVTPMYKATATTVSYTHLEVDRLTDYYAKSMMTKPMQWFCRKSGKSKIGRAHV